MMRKVSLRAAALGCVALAGVLLQACASTAPKPPPASTPAPAVAPPVTAPSAPQFSATPGLSPRERLQKLLQLLNDGQRDQARAEVVQLLKEQPGDVTAQSLFDQIDKDPKLLLGEKNFPYRIQPGDSISSLAQRYLGDRLLFYALARYNNIDKPGAAEVGQTILIPGVPGKPAPRPVRPSRPENDEGEVRGKKPAPPATPAPAPPAPLRDPGRAASLRGQALTALNGGAADRAVALLRQAAGLDPENAAIKRDLARAQRIQATVHK